MHLFYFTSALAVLNNVKNFCYLYDQISKKEKDRFLASWENFWLLIHPHILIISYYFNIFIWILFTANFLFCIFFFVYFINLFIRLSCYFDSHLNLNLNIFVIYSWSSLISYICFWTHKFIDYYFVWVLHFIYCKVIFQFDFFLKTKK